MKRFLTALAFLLMSTISHAAAVWDIDVHSSYTDGSQFSLIGTFTTADQNVPRGDGEVITSFQGTFSNNELSDQSISLVSLGQTVCASPTCDEVFFYDNLFFGPSDRAAGWPIDDSFNSNGLLLVTGSTYVNLFASSQLIEFDFNPTNNAFQAEFATGSITFDHMMTAVPEPETWLMLGMALGLLLIRKRKS